MLRFSGWWAIVFAVAAGSSVTVQDLAFDVVSIRPAPVNVRGSGSAGATLRYRPGGVRSPAITAERLIAHAYPVGGAPRLRSRIAGGPEWMTSTRFEFVATTTGDTSQAVFDERLPQLLRHVLEDRFRLRGHMEMRPLPLYALVTARRNGALGPLLRRSDPRAEPWNASGQEYISAIRMDMDTLASRLTGLNAAGRVVTNGTGLTGEFDIDLFWSPARTAVGGSVPPEVDGPSLFTAVQEQLGLKLQPRTELQDVFVVDYLERPTPN
jgi:uncharacterized protein (TIGR03435 family)